MTGPAMLLLLTVCCRCLGPSVNLLGQSFTYVLCIWLYETHQQALSPAPTFSSSFLLQLSLELKLAVILTSIPASVECFKLLPKRYTNLSSGHKFKAENTIICHAPTPTKCWLGNVQEIIREVGANLLTAFSFAVRFIWAS